MHGWCPWGVLEVPSGLVGTIYTQSNSGFMKTPYFENLADFSCVHVDMWWIGPMWPKCAFGDQKGLIWKESMLFGNPLHHGTKNCELFKKCRILIFYFLVKGDILSKKTVFGGVLDRV